MEFRVFDREGPVLLVPEKHGDSRGYFMETFRQNEFEEYCGHYSFVQDNQSKSTGRVLRGIHYQLKHPQGKLVRVIRGQVFDVAVDLRKSSPTFGKSYSAILDAVNNHMLWIPPCFGHGFMVIGEDAEFVYKCTDYYAPGDECTLLWNDSTLNIDWPDINPILSGKDKLGLSFAECPKYD